MPAASVDALIEHEERSRQALVHARDDLAARELAARGADGEQARGELLASRRRTRALEVEARLAFLALHRALDRARGASRERLVEYMIGRHIAALAAGDGVEAALFAALAEDG